MQFELTPDNTKAALTLNEQERKILNTALILKTLEAALEGGTQLARSSVQAALVKVFLGDHRNVGSQRLTVTSKHLDVMAESVTDYEKSVAYEDSGDVGGLAAQLGKVAQILTERAQETQNNINTIMQDIIIPNDINGIQ
jgi:hypothetical protein